MQDFGEAFIEALPRHIASLKIPGRAFTSGSRRKPLFAEIERVEDLQTAMHEVLSNPVTQTAQLNAENAFTAFLQKNKPDAGVLKFFNGWNETHKTTSLVSAKIIMRLAADAVSIPSGKQADYLKVMAHMHEVAKDDFGLGHEGHDGMYRYMTAAFDASAWVEDQYAVQECNEFSGFLYEAGVAQNKAPMDSEDHKQSIMRAMIVSVASELWNGREYNFIAQHIEGKLLSVKPALGTNVQSLRHAKGYVMGHAGEVENKHGLHALAAAQAYGRTVDVEFKAEQLKRVMLDYNARVGKAFDALHKALVMKV
jgi:hypothetical protein